MEGSNSDLQNRLMRAVRNQSLFRDVNEHIVETVAHSSSTFHSFACECADPKCVEVLSLTIQEYEHVRMTPTHYFVKPGHVVPDVDRVVETDGGGERYEVVEKFGEAGRLAVELDSRSQ